MAQNDARTAYIGGREKPTEAEVRSMTLTGGTGAMRALLEAGGWVGLSWFHMAIFIEKFTVARHVG